MGGLGGKERFASPKEKQGPPGLAGQGPRGGGRGPELLSPFAFSKATPAKAGAGLTQGEQLLTSGKAPPFLPTSWGGRALPWWWEPAATAPCTPPPLGLPGRRAPAVAAVSTLVPGGLRLRPPRCHPPRPRLWAVAAAEAAGNLRGAGCGSRGPSLLFHKPGPSQEQCRT